MQEDNINECSVKRTPEIDQMIGRSNDAIERLNEMRARLAQRNDRLFGCVPCETDGAKEDVADGAINELRYLLDTIHQRLSLLDGEIARQDNLT